MNSFQPILSFLDWWGVELRSFIPPTLRRALSLSRDQLFIRLDGRSVDAHLDRGDGLELVAATLAASYIRVAIALRAFVVAYAGIL